MSGLEGLQAVADGYGRWRILESGRPASEAELATVTGGEGRGYRLEPGAEPGPPAGPYGTLADAVEALATWRLARFRGDRA